MVLHLALFLMAPCPWSLCGVLSAVIIRSAAASFGCAGIGLAMCLSITHASSTPLCSWRFHVLSRGQLCRARRAEDRTRTPLGLLQSHLLFSPRNRDNPPPLWVGSLSRLLPRTVHLPFCLLTPHGLCLGAGPSEWPWVSSPLLPGVQHEENLLRLIITFFSSPHQSHSLEMAT